MEFVSGFAKICTLVNSNVDLLRRGGGHMKRFQYCADSTGQDFFFISVLSKVIQERILWIRLYKTMHYPRQLL